MVDKEKKVGENDVELLFLLLGLVLFFVEVEKYDLVEFLFCWSFKLMFNYFGLDVLEILELMERFVFVLNYFDKDDEVEVFVR